VTIVIQLPIVVLEINVKYLNMRCFKDLISVRGVVLTLVIVALFFPYLVSNAVTVGPVKLEIKADPGETLQGSTFLMNETKTAATYYPSFEGFTEEGGSKKFFKEASDLASWFQMPEAVHLDALEQKTIPYTIHVPEDASPGGHFAVMWWGTGNSSSGQQVSMITRAGILVYLRVSGDIIEKGAVSNFSAGKGKFVLRFPAVFNLSFKNDGNVYLKPQGNIEIKNIFGRTRNTIEVNKAGLSILPNSKKVLIVRKY